MNELIKVKPTNYVHMALNYLDNHFLTIGAISTGINSLLLAIDPSHITMVFTVSSGLITLFAGLPKAYLGIIKIVEIHKRWKAGRLNDVVEKEINKDE